MPEPKVIKQLKLAPRNRFEKKPLRVFKNKSGIQ